MKMLLSLAAVGAMALGAAPAAAQHHGHDNNRNNHNNNWSNDQRGDHHNRQAHRARWSNGYRFGPRYSYTSYNALPQAYVSRYHLSRRYRYVYNDGYIYQVDPTTYAVTRVIQALTGGY
jgi:Ni/Co efflux regulator RcnB